MMLKASTLRQPVPWALIHAGCDVINVDQWLTHFATCPNADQFRTPRT